MRERSAASRLITLALSGWALALSGIILALLGSALALTSCASTPTEKPAATDYLRWGEFAAYDRSHPPQEEPASLSAARDSLRAASPASMRKAARAIAAPELSGSGEAADLAGVGRELFGLLYPELTPNPFPADARSATYGPLFSAARDGKAVAPSAGENDFFRLVIPSLCLLQSKTRPEVSALNAFEAGLNKADEVSGKSSVLPPYLLALLTEARGSGSAQAAALSFYQESARRDSSFYPGQRKAADILLSTDKPKEAFTLLEALSASFPNDGALSKKTAQAALGAGKPEEALDAAARALMSAPEDTDSKLLRARAYELAGDWYQALRVLDALLKQTPDHRDALLMKARLLADDAGSSDEAVDLLSEAEDSFPKDSDIPELKGRILLDEGKDDEALNALNRALEIQPEKLSVLRLLLKDAVKDKWWLQAGSFLARIPDASKTLDDFSLGYTVAWNRGDYAQAAAYARKLVDANVDESARLLLALALHAQGTDAEVGPLVEAGLLQAKDHGVRSRLFFLRSVVERQTDPEAALKDLRSALFENPDNVEALLAISELLTSARELRPALGYLKRAAELTPDDSGLAAEIRILEKEIETQ